MFVMGLLHVQPRMRLQKQKNTSSNMHMMCKYPETHSKFLNSRKDANAHFKFSKSSQRERIVNARESFSISHYDWMLYDPAAIKYWTKLIERKGAGMFTVCLLQVRNQKIFRINFESAEHTRIFPFSFKLANSQWNQLKSRLNFWWWIISCSSHILLQLFRLQLLLECSILVVVSLSYQCKRLTLTRPSTRWIFHKQT